MWFLPLLLLGAVAVAASRSPRERPRRQLAPPGPIAVLGEYVRCGNAPPPAVILCAIAEAEAIGRDDLASDIIRVFIAPVVYAAPPQRALGRGERRVACAPREEVLYTPQGVIPMPPGPSTQLWPPEANYPGMDPVFAAKVRGALAARETPSPVAIQVPTSDDEIRTMLNADPERFIAIATRGAPIEVVRLEAPSEEPRHETVEQPGSPLANVSDDAWRRFESCLSRESPTFSSSRHVGQYRQRRERLAELGINPDTLHGSAQAQRAALDADLVDALQHASNGGLIEHVGRPVRVPGREETETISLSGVLGVIQCAGLDGAVGWLGRPGDRKKYPHTTQVFLRTNGCF